MPSSQEWAHLYSRPDVYNLEFLHARFIRHRYPRHVHDFYVFGIIEAGAQTFSTRRDKHATAQGGIIILNPDEPHTGEAATETGFTYKAVYPTASMLQTIASQVAGRSAPPPFFTGPVIYDAAMSARLMRLHQALIAPGGIGGETLLLDFFAGMISRYADTRFVAAEPPEAASAIRTVRDYLEAHYAEPVSLGELARLVSLSPYHLARLFTSQIGIPPHAYLDSVRIRQARRLLSAGFPIVDVALATGFADQSHFTQRFKRAVGLPPGEFIKDRKIHKTTERAWHMISSQRGRSSPMQFDTKIAVALKEDLPTWQKLNMTAFLVSGIAADPEVIGADYEDASGTLYLPMFVQPVMIFGASGDQLRQVYRYLLEKEVRFSIFTEDLFSTGYDEANRAAVKAVASGDLKLTGLAVRARKKVVDNAFKGLALHK